MKYFFRLPLNIRLFIINFVLILFTAITTGLITFFYFSYRTEKFYTHLLEQKEENILTSFTRHIAKHEKENENDIAQILEHKIIESSTIQNIPIAVYSLNGELVLSSEKDSIKLPKTLTNPIIAQIKRNGGKYRQAQQHKELAAVIAYRYLNNAAKEPIAILSIPFIQDKSIINSEISQLIKNLLIGNLFVIIIALLIAWYAAMQYRKRLSTIISNMNQSNLLQLENNYDYHANDELGKLFNSHRMMLKKFQVQAVDLIKLERELAWKDIAKQVAHEIKNPLTPMRLLIQNFQMRFDPKDEHAVEKINELSKGLIHQIDVLNSIATAFSEYTNMPDRRDIELDVIKEIETCLEIFDENAIKYVHPNEKIYIHFDHTSLFRIITNLVKNAFQAIPDDREPAIIVSVEQKETKISIAVKDNGDGISEENMSKVFIPEFSTKTTGSGLGLPMVKKIIEDYNGVIFFYNNLLSGTTFVIELPINKNKA